VVVQEWLDWSRLFANYYFLFLAAAVFVALLSRSSHAVAQRLPGAIGALAWLWLVAFGLARLIGFVVVFVGPIASVSAPSDASLRPRMSDIGLFALVLVFVVLAAGNWWHGRPPWAHVFPPGDPPKKPADAEAKP